MPAISWQLICTVRLKLRLYSPRSAHLCNYDPNHSRTQDHRDMSISYTHSSASTRLGYVYTIRWHNNKYPTCESTGNGHLSLRRQADCVPANYIFEVSRRRMCRQSIVLGRMSVSINDSIMSGGAHPNDYRSWFVRRADLEIRALRDMVEQEVQQILGLLRPEPNDAFREALVHVERLLACDGVHADDGVLDIVNTCEVEVELSEPRFQRVRGGQARPGYGSGRPERLQSARRGGPRGAFEIPARAVCRLPPATRTECLLRFRAQATRDWNQRMLPYLETFITWSKMKKKVVPGVCFSYDWSTER